MGTLVNPVGWRVNSNMYWKVNFFISDDKFGLQTNNFRVHYVVLDGVLTKLNKVLLRFGFLKFIRSSILLLNSELFIIVVFRWRRDLILRSKFRWRRFRYYRREKWSRKRSLLKLGGRINRQLVNMLKYSREIRFLKKELKYLYKNRNFLKDKNEKKKLLRVITQKRRKLYKTKVNYEQTKVWLYYRPQYLSLFKKYNRQTRVRSFLYSQNPPLEDFLFASGARKLMKKYRKLFRYKARRKVRIRLRSFLIARGFNRLHRFKNFVPGYGSGTYVRHRRVMCKNIKIAAYNFSKVCSGVAVKKTKARRLKVLKSRKRFFWRIVQKKKTRGRGRRFKKRMLTRWMRTPKRRASLAKNFLVYSIFLYFKIVPFIVDLKFFIMQLFNKTHNLGFFNVYMLNATKPVAVSAKVMLEFVESFLKKRRRVTKINKLFYRLLKILRVFKAKYRLRGFKLLLAGRFLRRDRATYIWRTRGAVPLGTKLRKIDFAMRSMQMKYSRPIVKLWICKR